jgi:hypothetical protein
MEQEHGTFKVDLLVPLAKAARNTREGWRQLPNFWAYTSRRRQNWLEIKRFVEDTNIFSAQKLVDSAFPARREDELHNKNKYLMPEAGVAWFLRFRKRRRPWGRSQRFTPASGR